jgi:hypothetical protein
MGVSEKVLDASATLSGITRELYDYVHHQPINVPTAGAQAFLTDYPQGERVITHHAGPVRIGGC